jgi:Sigma-70 region 2
MPRRTHRLGVREEDLMDLTQKVFLTANLKLPRFEGRSLLSTWLWSISRRVAIAHRRSGPMRREVTTDPSSFERLPEESNSVTNDGESARQAQAILSKDTEAQCVVFLLFEVDPPDGEAGDGRFPKASASMRPTGHLDGRRIAVCDSVTAEQRVVDGVGVGLDVTGEAAEHLAASTEEA